MQIVVQVENVKCGGCVSAIRDGLMQDARVTGVEVEIASGTVTVEARVALGDDLGAALAKLGFPVAA